MELSLLLAKRIAALVIMALAGFTLVKLKILKSSDSRILSLISTYVLIPSVVLKAFQIENSADNIQDMAVLLFAAIMIHAVYIIMTVLLRKPMKLSGGEQASLIYTNCGNLITPIVSGIFGEELLFCPSVFATLQILIIWTHGYALMSNGKMRSLRKIFTNFNIIIVFIAFALFLLHIQIPSIVMTALDGLGSMLGPVGMLIIGMLIADVNLKSALSNLRTLALSALRLLVYPLVIVLLFKITGIVNLASRPEVLIISLLAAAAPSAMAIINMAQLNNLDTQSLVSVNVVTTLLCILSMPLMVLIFQWIIL